MGTKGDMTKQHIRAAAFELFAVYGYKKVTMRDICEKTGLSKGGLYRHYEDKCQLFTEILAELQKEETGREALGIRQGLPAAEIFDGFLDHLKQDFSKSSPNINIALYEFCVEHKDGIGADILSAQFQKGRAALTALIEYGISDGSFHVNDPQGAASAVLFLAEGLRMINEVMPVSDEILTEVMDQIREIMGVQDEHED